MNAALVRSVQGARGGIPLVYIALHRLPHVEGRLFIEAAEFLFDQDVIKVLAAVELHALRCFVMLPLSKTTALR